MLECEAPTLGNKVGELEGAVDDSLWFLHGVGFRQAFNAESEDVDESESSFFFVLWDIDAVRGDSFSHVLRGFVYCIVQNSKVFFEHVDRELSDQRGFATAYCSD